jgi:membrane fusion protein, copper/silver efflux system
MRKVLGCSSVSVAIVAIAAASFMVGASWSHRDGTSPSRQAERKILYYGCPMHPLYHADKPGECPTCGMRLEPVYADVAARSPRDDDDMPTPRSDAVQVTPDRQQAIGVKFGVADEVAGMRSLRTTGRVVPGENATYRLNAAVDGWIRDVRGATTGSFVQKNQILATFYAPEFLAAEQAYLFAAGALDRFQTTGTETDSQIELTRANIQQAVDSLRNLGMSDLQIRELEQNRQLVQNIYITAPVSGFVLERGLSVGQRFQTGTEFFRIAELSHVWILADIFEDQAQHVQPGTIARVTAVQQRRQITARVSSVQPVFDDLTRTLKVRLEAANPGFVLKPGMFVDVEIPIELPQTLTVPADAVIDSGLRKTVFVDRGNGYFESREVETGWRADDRVEVRRGLTRGERIVVSGTFLLDSESRMKAPALEKGRATARDPVCGMEVDKVLASKAGRQVDRDGQAYFFCSDACKKRFDEEPERYLSGRHADGVALSGAQAWLSPSAQTSGRMASGARPGK